jgi:hypothetical protein
VISRPEDDPEAMKIILSIVHGHYQNVPQTITCDQQGNCNMWPALYHVAVLVDKYDLARLLQPWVRNWMNMNSYYLMTSLFKHPMNGSRNAERLLWCAWEFGNTLLLTRVMGKMCRGLALRDDGTLIRDSTTNNGLENPVWCDVPEVPGASGMSLWIIFRPKLEVPHR